MDEESLRQQLVIEQSTLRNHLSNIRKILGVNSTKDAVRFAMLFLI
jgi:DNA-binding CsgD family transcriptional regulator